MRRLTWVLVTVLVTTLVVTGLVLADWDEDDDDDHRGRGIFSRWNRHQEMTYNTPYSQLYRDECGSCHFPFQPGFLPADSWQSIMQGLENHFDENAELADDERQQITEFLLANSAGAVDGEIPNKAMWSLRYTPEPMRITETAFFRHEHREIPPRILHQEERDISFANCDSCHTRALQGSYNEHEIRIPGVGRWEDD
ncbi:MAG: diheme cytochrome c [Candidatus Thiodiazotropha sp.]